MGVWAIVPVKPLRRGKSRLASVLSEEERTLINCMMLGHTLKTLSQLPEIEQVLVVSKDPAALAMARDHRARTVLEVGAPSLNPALERATVVARIYSARGVLVIPADLPVIQPETLRTFLGYFKDPPVVIIAPDRRGEGTNALFLSPLGLFNYAFGHGSFQRHCDNARKSHARLEVCELPELGLDLDLPEDLEIVMRMGAIHIPEKRTMNTLLESYDSIGLDGGN